MDQQVVRSALKSYRNLFSSNLLFLSSLSPSSNYLRLLTPPALNVSLSIQDFADPNTSILLLELRAALIVQDHAKNLATGDIDASVNQRVSKAVTEAFVAVQVAGMIKGLEDDEGMKGNDADVVKKVYLLVGHFYPFLLFAKFPLFRTNDHLGDGVFFYFKFFFSQYLLTTVEGALVDLLSFGLMRPKATYGESPLSSIDPTRALRLAIQRLCQELIPETIGLTDAFGFTDWDLDRLVIFFLFLFARFSNNGAAFY